MAASRRGDRPAGAFLGCLHRWVGQIYSTTPNSLPSGRPFRQVDYVISGTIDMETRSTCWSFLALRVLAVENVNSLLGPYLVFGTRHICGAMVVNTSEHSPITSGRCWHVWTIFLEQDVSICANYK